MKDSLWHTFSPDSLLKRFDTSHLGLMDEEVKKRLYKNGMNILKTPLPRTTSQQIMSHLLNPLYLILSVVAFVKFLLGEMAEAIAIGFVIGFNVILGLIQEWKSQKALDSLLSTLSPTALVIREGEESLISASHLVPGDLLLLRSGMKVAADARLLESIQLEVDESSLTGESFPVSKEASANVKKEAALSDRINMVYQGTTVVQGRAKAIVIATGMSTQFGAMYGSLTLAEPQKPPIQKKLELFGKHLTLFILMLMAGIVAVGYFQGYSLYDLLMTALSLAVSAIPEGLPIAMTVALSYGLYQMAKRSAIIRRLSAVEALGCTTVVCTDKTGTLTQNKMDPALIMIGEKSGGEEILFEKSSPATQALFKRCTLFSSETPYAHIHEGGPFHSPIEEALMTLVAPLPFTPGKEKHTLLIPFESKTQRAVAQTTTEEETLLWCKGSPERVAHMCTHQIMLNGTHVPFQSSRFLEAIETFSSEGFRTIALAYRHGNSTQEDMNTGFTLIGAIGMIDPPREQAKEAIRSCQKAGIRVYMITGDHPKTALSIARGVDLSHLHEEALLGTTIDALSDEELTEQLRHHSIIARAAPSHKLRIVALLQKQGQIVAMTGDGVNDTPPLKQADIGIAMGSGTDAAKEASSMVVLDDNFSTIVEALRYGRTIYKNIQHMILYLLSTCFGGVLTIAFAVLLKLPLPLPPLQLLWMNLITDGSTIVPLAFEKEHGDAMDSPPRDTKEPLITKHMWRRTFLSSGLMCLATILLFTWSLFSQQNGLDKSRTLAFSALAFFQIFNAFNARSLFRSLFFTLHHRGKTIPPIQARDNPLFLWIVSLASLLQVAVVEMSWCNQLLQTTHLTFFDWCSVIALSSTVILVSEIDKFLLSKKLK